MTPSPLLLGLAGAGGLALGSFAVTSGLRMARGGSALVGRSQCDDCGRRLGFLETVPLASYAGLRGTCSGCGSRIDPTHVAGEAAGGLIIVASLFVAEPLRAALAAALGLALVASATADAKSGRLPDILTALIAALGLALSALRGVDAVVTGLVAALVVVAVLVLLRAFGYALRREAGLGLGDVKLLGALALWLGASTPWLIAGAAIVGLMATAVLRPAAGRLRFGPAIAAAACIVGLGREVGLWPTTP